MLQGESAHKSVGHKLAHNLARKPTPSRDSGREPRGEDSVEVLDSNEYLRIQLTTTERGRRKGTKKPLSRAPRQLPPVIPTPTRRPSRTREYPSGLLQAL